MSENKERIRCTQCDWEVEREQGFWKQFGPNNCPLCASQIFIYPEVVTATQGGHRKVPEDEWKPEAITALEIEREAERKTKIQQQRALKALNMVEALLRYIHEFGYAVDRESEDCKEALEGCRFIRRELSGGER